jgi:hypothetical protein
MQTPQTRLHSDLQNFETSKKVAKQDIIDAIKSELTLRNYDFDGPPTLPRDKIIDNAAKRAIPLNETLIRLCNTLGIDPKNIEEIMPIEKFLDIKNAQKEPRLRKNQVVPDISSLALIDDKKIINDALVDLSPSFGVECISEESGNCVIAGGKTRKRKTRKCKNRKTRKTRKTGKRRKSRTSRKSRKTRK